MACPGKPGVHLPFWHTILVCALKTQISAPKQMFLVIVQPALYRFTFSLTKAEVEKPTSVSCLVATKRAPSGFQALRSAALALCSTRQKSTLLPQNWSCLALTTQSTSPQFQVSQQLQSLLSMSHDIFIDLYKVNIAKHATNQNASR